MSALVRLNLRQESKLSHWSDQILVWYEIRWNAWHRIRGWWPDDPILNWRWR